VKRYLTTTQLSATRAFDGGLLYMLGGHLLKLASLVILLLLWRSLAAQGADLGGFTLEQLLAYTLLASILREQLSVITPATTAFWEGSIISRYLRPLPVLGQMIAETVGGWLPGLALYTLPMICIAGLLGINLLPILATNGPLFLCSLLLAVSLGFALDFLYASLVIYVKNASYQAYTIRQAITSLFSGAVIPFALLPWGLGRALEMLPFGSVASAPLLVLVGVSDPLRLIGLQLIWNLVFWPVTIWAFRGSEERMVSYGG
jgi:ABC-2 type transport system permease protein